MRVISPTNLSEGRKEDLEDLRADQWRIERWFVWTIRIPSDDLFKILLFRSRNMDREIIFPWTGFLPTYIDIYLQSDLWHDIMIWYNGQCSPLYGRSLGGEWWVTMTRPCCTLCFLWCWFGHQPPTRLTWKQEVYRETVNILLLWDTRPNQAQNQRNNIAQCYALSCSQLVISFILIWVATTSQ